MQFERLQSMLRPLLGDLFTILRSVAPFVLVLVTLKLALRSPFDSPKNACIGAFLVLVGLFCLQKGINMCLQPMAEDVGHGLIILRRHVWLILAIAFAIGFCATLVEPALKPISQQVEEATVGTISAKILIHATAFGSGIGMLCGIAKVVYDKPILPFVLPFLVLLIILIPLSKDIFTSVAFDCAAATTGPVNIPINAAIALGLATALGLDPMRVGFGLVGLSCLGSAVSVLAAPHIFRLAATLSRLFS